MPGSTSMLVASGSGLFYVRVCYPNAKSYRGLTTKQIYRHHESEKKRMYASRVLEVEKGSFIPLVFTTTGGMAGECMRYHSRLAELLSTKKGEYYSTTMSWIRAKSLIRPPEVCAAMLERLTLYAKSTAEHYRFRL